MTMTPDSGTDRRAHRGIEPELPNALIGYLHQERDAGRCQTPISIETFEQLLDGSLGNDASVREHLADCLFCLNAYAELQGASTSLLAQETPTSIFERLEARVQQLATDFEQALRRLRNWEPPKPKFAMAAVRGSSHRGKTRLAKIRRSRELIS